MQLDANFQIFISNSLATIICQKWKYLALFWSPFSYPHRVKREAEEVERKKREEAEAAEKARAEAAKKEKEGAKKALKKERKQLRTLCKDHEFYAKDEEEKLVHMTELEKLCELLQVRIKSTRN